MSKRIEYILEDPIKPRGFIRSLLSSIPLLLIIITGIAVIVAGWLVCTLEEGTIKRIVDAAVATFIVSTVVFIFTLIFYTAE